MSKNEDSGPYSGSPQVQYPRHGSTKSYHLSRTSLHTTYQITDGACGRVFLSGKLSEFTPGKPDLTVSSHSGPGNRIVGICRMRHERKVVHMGMTSSGSDDLQWEDLVRGPGASEYSFPFTLDDGSRQMFQWTKTHTSDDKRRWQLTNKEGAILVDCVRDSSLTKETAVLEVSDGMGQSLEEVALVSLLAVWEKKRRRDEEAADWFDELSSWVFGT